MEIKLCESFRGRNVQFDGATCAYIIDFEGDSPGNSNRTKSMQVIRLLRGRWQQKQGEKKKNQQKTTPTMRNRRQGVNENKENGRQQITIHRD